MKKIFILASERSGTNLLRKLLASHSQLSGPLPLHAWNHLSNLLPYYGPLEISQNYDHLLGDALYLANITNSTLSWDKNLKKKDLEPFLAEKNLSSTIAALYSAYATIEKNTGWVCKEIKLFEHTYDILSTFPEAKFIYLVRDGRDVAASTKKMLSQSRVIYHIVHKWKTEQLKCISIYNNLKSNTNVNIIRYEDLITNPIDQLTSICKFIGIPFEEQMLQFYTTPSSIIESTIHNLGNLSKPLNQNNFNKYRTELSTEEIKLFEHIGGDVLSLLGYSLDYPDEKMSISRFKKIKYLIQNNLYRRQDRTIWKTKKGVKNRQTALKKLYDRRQSGI